MTPSPAQFDYAKLDWMNGMYIRALPEQEFAHALIIWLGEQGYDWDAELVRKAAPLVQEKLTRLDEFPAYARFLFEDVQPDPAELDGGAPVLAAARDALAELEPFTAESIEAALRCGARAARPEAAAGISADSRCGDGLEDVAGPLREHRAARTRDDSVAAQRAAASYRQGLRRPERVECALESKPGPSSELHRRSRQCLVVLRRVPRAHELARVCCPFSLATG